MPPSVSLDDPEWASLRAAHERAVGEFLDAVGALDEAAWRTAPAPGKWCPGQVAEHLVLTYGAFLRELQGRGRMRVRTRWWLRAYLRLRVLPRMLKDNRFPSGAPAVREVRPAPDPRTPADVVADLRDKAAEFAEALTRSYAAGGGRLTHPFFGSVPALKALRVATMHIEHHRDQIPARIDRSSGGP
jgi:hypothetical protein